MLYILQRRILFNTSSYPGKPSDYGLNLTKEIQILTEDKINLLSWYHKSNEKLPLLIYLHGNSSVSYTHLTLPTSDLV